MPPSPPATPWSDTARPIDFLCEYVLDRGYDMRFAIEPKPNEPRGDIFLPTVGHALAFIERLQHAEMVGVNPEVAHETMAGLSFQHAVSQALWAGKLFHIDLNAQRIGRYDQDFRFGAVGLKDAFFVVKLLEDAGYEGPRHFDARPLRVENEDGIWDFAAGCMRTYLALAEKARRFDADPEIQAALAETKVPELAQPTVGRLLARGGRRIAGRAARPGRTRHACVPQRAPRPAGDRPAARTAVKPAEPRDIRRHNLSLVLEGVADRGPRSPATIALETGSTRRRCRAWFPSCANPASSGSPARSAPEQSAGRPRTSDSTRRGRSSSGSRSMSTTSRSGPRTWAGAVLHRSFTASDNRGAPGERGCPPGVTRARGAGERTSRVVGQPVASAVAVPGIVGHGGEVVVAPEHPLGESAARRDAQRDLGTVTVENEANLGALAELTEGAGRGFANFVYLSAEVGIGAGIVLGGELFRGAHGFGGEIGHLTIDPYGPPCPCGSRGCLERLAGQDALLRLAGWDPRVRGRGRRPEWPGAMLADSAPRRSSQDPPRAQPGGPHTWHRGGCRGQPAQPPGPTPRRQLRPGRAVAA